MIKGAFCPTGKTEKLLLSTDGTDYTEGAIREVLSFAKKCSSRLCALSVIESRVRTLFLIIPLLVALLYVCSGFAEVAPPPSSEAENKELKTPEPIEKSEEAREQEKIRKFEQTQYDLDEMGMTLEERKMRRVRPNNP